MISPNTISSAARPPVNVAIIANGIVVDEIAYVFYHLFLLHIAYHDEWLVEITQCQTQLFVEVGSLVSAMYTGSFDLAQPCVFVKQLPGPILCALP